MAQPITREEFYLAKMAGDDVATPAPVTRTEVYYDDIINSTGNSPDPVTREEVYLANIAGADVAVPAPVTRLEHYLARIAGEDVENPDPPRTRKEYFLSKWAEGGGGDLPEGYREVIGLQFSSKCYYEIEDFKLRGSDTVTFSFSVTKSCNVMGCYTTASATTNYSLYASTSSGGKYLRYSNGTYSSYIPNDSLGERLDVVITPTGSQGMPREDTWEQADFESVTDLCICNTSTGSTSAKLDGCIFGRFIVNNRLTLIPCERTADGILGYYDIGRGRFFEPIGDNPVSLGYIE